MKPKTPSNRSFGIVFFIFFTIIGIYPIINGNEPKVSLLIIASIFLILGAINSKLLTPLNKLWMKFGLILGKFISPIVMSLVFFLVLTPIALLVRITGKDVLKLKFSKEKSYWNEKDKKTGSMKKQF
tara:strand:- start:3962 stop:4342 length:381 start_codon:yes stop_codon:yes gene_type:complete